MPQIQKTMPQIQTTSTTALNMFSNRFDNDSLQFSTNNKSTNSEKITEMLEKGVDSMQNALMIAKVISATVFDKKNNIESTKEYVTKIQLLSMEIQKECDFSLKYLQPNQYQSSDSNNSMYFSPNIQST